MIYAKVSVTAKLNELGLVALYWDYLSSVVFDEEDAYNMIIGMDDSHTRKIVRGQLMLAGSRSVECGPNNPYLSERVERAALVRIRNAYSVS